MRNQLIPGSTIEESVWHVIHHWITVAVDDRVLATLEIAAQNGDIIRKTDVIGFWPEPDAIRTFVRNDVIGHYMARTPPPMFRSID